MTRVRIAGLAVGALLLAAATLIALSFQRPGVVDWSPEEIAAIRSLWIGSLEPLAPDPSNAYADDPAAAALGQALFFDTRLSANGKVACATCHLPDRSFQDGLPLARGIGQTDRRTMTVIGAAYSPWLFWDGRKDSLWSQALGPLESAVEHGGDRAFYVHLIATNYSADYEAIFGPLPELALVPLHAGPVADAKLSEAWAGLTATDQDAINRVFANMGKAIAAYERLLLPGPTRFDRYAEAVLTNDATAAASLLNADEVAGLRLFVGQAECIKCHNGPLFTNNDFHNTGVPAVVGQAPDPGRANGVAQVVADPFNCLGNYSDAEETACAELKYMVTDGPELAGQFRPPSLRGVAERAPYMHAGQMADLETVLEHYTAAPPAAIGLSELEPLGLTTIQQGQLIAFLRTVSEP